MKRRKHWWELIDESNRGEYKVIVYDGTMDGCDTSFSYARFVTRAVAKSIARHFNRNIYRYAKEHKCEININYTIECEQYGYEDYCY